MNRACQNCLFRYAVHLTVFAVMSSPALTGFSASAADVKVPELQAAAEQGFVPQQVELAAAYFAGRGVTQDLKMAAYWYQKAAEGGDPAAQNEIGFLYQTGTGVQADPARAMHFYQLSAAAGFVRAKVNLGVLYVWGIGVRKDEALAAQLFREAAEKGDGAAASYLGDMYHFGMGMKQDNAAAESWYVTGVRLHDPVAAYNLGSLFFGRGGHPRDLQKAATLLRQSAEGGYVRAMHSLALLLVNDPELLSSPHEACLWLETASNAGYWKSSAVLGVLAREGKDTTADPVAAYYYFQVAALQGGELASRLLANDLHVLSAKIPAERASALVSSANTWFQQHHLTLAFVSKDNENWRRFPAAARTVDEEGAHAGKLVPPAPDTPEPHS